MEGEVNSEMAYLQHHSRHVTRASDLMAAHDPRELFMREREELWGRDWQQHSLICSNSL